MRAGRIPPAHPPTPRLPGRPERGASMPTLRKRERTVIAAGLALVLAVGGYVLLLEPALTRPRAGGEDILARAATLAGPRARVDYPGPRGHARGPARPCRAARSAVGGARDARAPGRRGLGGAPSRAHRAACRVRAPEDHEGPRLRLGGRRSQRACPGASAAPGRARDPRGADGGRKHSPDRHAASAAGARQQYRPGGGREETRGGGRAAARAARYPPGRGLSTARNLRAYLAAGAAALWRSDVIATVARWVPCVVLALLAVAAGGGLVRELTRKRPLPS